MEDDGFHATSQDWWYNHPKYQRYWRTYHQSMKWYHKHKFAFWKAEAAAQKYSKDALLNLCLHNVTNNHYSHCSSSTENSDEESAARTNVDVETNADESEDEFEFEITEEMMEFFETSRKHREELRIERMRKQNAEDETEDYINLENYFEGRECRRSNLAPEEKPGARRLTEMKLLYGKAAPMIHGMETAMQLNFDRHCDLKQLKLWPNIPIKI